MLGWEEEGEFAAVGINKYDFYVLELSSFQLDGL
jgi:UDP-N-acetylmuramoylalanine-D-glutamate ligase